MTYLCRHQSGVYYYRKTFVTPSGKRQEIRRSLKTTDYKHAQYLALKLYFNIGPDRDVVGFISDQKTGEQVAAITQPRPGLLRTAIKRFLKEKSRLGVCCAKEYRRGEVMLEALSNFFGNVETQAVGKMEANQFKQSLSVSSYAMTNYSMSLGQMKRF